MLPFARDAVRRPARHPRFEAAVALAQERATTLVQIAEQMAFLFTPDDELEIDPASWEKADEGRARGRHPRRGHRVRRRLRVDRRDRSAARDRGARAQTGQGHARPVHRDRGSRARGCRCSTRSACSGRESALAPAAGGSRPACEAVAQDRVADRDRSVRARVRVPLGRVRAGVVGGAPRRRPAVATRSSCSAPRSSTADRRRSSRRGSTTRSTCTAAASRRSIVVTGGKQPGDRFTEASVERELPARSRRPRARDPARDDRAYVVGVARGGRRAS